mmetsp:Transcript_22743/g.71460  ORF Transcript_22743/g.71460 Transcript_22743/m.71460 type:complete len:344 (+) Transcript_22743:174-1205(+)
MHGLQPISIAYSPLDCSQSCAISNAPLLDSRPASCRANFQLPARVDTDTTAHILSAGPGEPRSSHPAARRRRDPRASQRGGGGSCDAAEARPTNPIRSRRRARSAVAARRRRRRLGVEAADGVLLGAGGEQLVGLAELLEPRLTLLLLRADDPALREAALAQHVAHRRAADTVGVLKDVGDERLPARNLRPKDGLHEGARRLEPPPLRRRRVPDARSSAKPSVRSHRDRPQRVSQRVDELERLPARVGAGGVPHEGGESKRDDVSALLGVLVRGRHPRALGKDLADQLLLRAVVEQRVLQRVHELLRAVEREARKLVLDELISPCSFINYARRVHSFITRACP